MIRDRIRAGLESLGGVFTRATDFAPIQAWLAGMDMPDDYTLDGGTRRMSDPYIQSVFCFQCVSGIGKMLGRVPWELVDENDEVAYDDPIGKLFEQPTETMTWPWWVRTWVMFTLASGNGDLLIGPVSLATGLPRWVRPTPPGQLQPHRPNPADLHTVDFWEYRPPFGGLQPQHPDNVIRLQYAPTADPWRGVGPLTVARMAAELNYHGDQYNVSSLKKGGLPRSVLTLKNQTSIPPEQRALIKDEFNQNIGGPRNAGSMMLLTGDMDFKALGWSPIDMDWLNAQKWGREEISVAFDYPLAFLAGSDNRGLNDGGRQADERRLYISNLMPLGDQMEAALNVAVRRWSGGRLRFRFNWSTIEALQPQMTERVTQATQLVTSGWTRNEVNERFELGFEDNDEWGNEAFVSGGMTTARSVVEGGNWTDMLSGLLGPGGTPALPPGQDVEIVDGELVDDAKLLAGPDDDDQEEGEEKLPSDAELERWIRSAAAWTAYPTTKDERRRFWRATVWAPSVRLEKVAIGRVKKHFQKQRGRIIKALGKTKRGWRPGGIRVSNRDIDRALDAYQVGGLAEALFPVAEKAFVAGLKSAAFDMVRAANSTKRRKRATGDALQKLIDKQVEDGKLTAAEAKKITTEQELDEALAAKGYGTAASGARFGDAIKVLDIPLEYAPNGTEQIKLAYFDPRLQLWTIIDEGVRAAIGASLREGYTSGETLRELKQRVADLMGEVSHSRTRTIARTEVGTMRNGGRFHHMREQGVEVVEWLAEQDERTRESHADVDGEQVRLGERFSNGLAHPGELGAPAGEVINCRCTLLPIARGLTDAPDAGGDDDWLPEAAGHDVVLLRSPKRGPPVRMYRGYAAQVRAAADRAHTGVMVALVPRLEDAQRLATAGGEPVDELHVTLFYFGDASAMPIDARQDLVDAVRETAGRFGALAGKTFGAGVFNPTGDKPCVVLNVGGAAVDAFRKALEARLGSPPDEHRPWAAHMTLTYDHLGDLPDDWLAARMGPVVFDRVRVAFAGQAIDVPFAEVLDVRAASLADVCRRHGVPVVRGDISLA